MGLSIYFWPATFRPHLLVCWSPDKIKSQWGLTYWSVSILLYLTRLVNSLQTEFWLVQLFDFFFAILLITLFHSHHVGTGIDFLHFHYQIWVFSSSECIYSTKTLKNDGVAVQQSKSMKQNVFFRLFSCKIWCFTHSFDITKSIDWIVEHHINEWQQKTSSSLLYSRKENCACLGSQLHTYFPSLVYQWICNQCMSSDLSNSINSITITP